MALAIYGNALREFETALSSVRLYLRFIATANQLRPRVMNVVDWQILNADPEQKQLLTSFASQKDYQIQIGLNGLVVSLASEFEKYLRRLIVEGVMWINGTLSTYEEACAAHQALMHHNLAHSAAVLGTIYRPPAEPVYDYEMVCENLGTCRKNGGKLKLNALAFTFRLSNATVERINDGFKRLCLQIDWDRIGDDGTLRTLMDETTSGRTSNAVQDWLNEFSQKRNKIAHGGIGSVTMTGEDVEKAIDVLKAFGIALATEIEGLLKKKHKLPATS